MDKLAAQTDFFRKFNIKESEFKNTGLEWEELERIYEDHTNNIPFLESQILILFSEFVKMSNVHSVKYRVKSPEHLIEKIIRKKIEEPERNITFDTYINEIDDLLGIRVLHLYKDEWENIHEQIIGNNYKFKETPTAYYREGDSTENIDKYKLHGCTPKQHKYGYRSIHYIIQQKILSNTIACEVQVRTVFEEAWSEIDHDIRYPYDMDNPIYKQYLMIVNRLAGSADEMGTFVVHLKEHFAKQDYEYQEEIDKKNTVINELKKELSELKLSKKAQESINSKIDKLTNNSDIRLTSPSKYPWLSNYVPQNVWQGVSAGASIAESAHPSNSLWQIGLTNVTSLNNAAMAAAKLSNSQNSVLDMIRNSGMYGSTPLGYSSFTGMGSVINSVSRPATTLNELFQKSNSVMNNIPNIFPTEEHDTGDGNI